MDDKQLESIDLNDEKMKDFQEGNIEIASSESGEEKESGKAREIMLFLIGLFAGIGVTMILCIFLILIPWSKEKKAAEAAEAEKTALEQPLSYNRKVNTLKSILKQYYYEDVSEEDIEESIYKGIIKATGDRYSEYYSAEERKIANEDWEGKFYGIGAVLYYDDEARYTRIESVEDGSPAKEAGLEADDYIIEVDGTDIEGMPVSDVVRLVRGEEGTDVKLGIIRGKEYKEYTITRGEIKQTTVAYEKMDDGVAYIAIGSFSDTTVESFAEAIQQAKDDGAKGVIFDIRGNGGGGLDVCVAMCQQFLPAGLIVYTQDKYGQKEEFYSDGTNEWDIPMVVLVNGGSASASEIFTAALKDMGVAKIVGTKTYGKGVYQVVVPLKDESAVKVTNGRFYSPKGECFHEVGIEPDVEAKLDVDAYYKDGTDSQLDEAINVLREEMGLERIEKEVTSEETSEGTSEEKSEKTSEK